MVAPVYSLMSIGGSHRTAIYMMINQGNGVFVSNPSFLSYPGKYKGKSLNVWENPNRVKTSNHFCLTRYVTTGGSALVLS